MYFFHVVFYLTVSDVLVVGYVDSVIGVDKCRLFFAAGVSFLCGEWV